jgi:Flp pilus assembly protein protease CpaA
LQKFFKSIFGTLLKAHPTFFSVGWALSSVLAIFAKIILKTAILVGRSDANFLASAALFCPDLSKIKFILASQIFAGIS